MKIRPVAAELFHAEGMTNRRDEANNRFPQFCECAIQQHSYIRYDIWYDIRYDMIRYDIWYDMTYFLTAIGLPPGGSCTIHIYTQTIHRTTHNKQYIQHNNFKNNTKILEEWGPCPDLASYTLAFALQLREKHGKTSARVVEQYEYMLELQMQYVKQRRTL